MSYLQRIDYRPSMANLPPEEEQFLSDRVQVYGAELVIEGKAVRWEYIEEVEVVPAPRAQGLSGWLVKRFFLNNDERYHLGVYFGSQEAILPNISINVARHVLEEIAYFAPKQVFYRGPENLVAITEI